jgi:hypothetical protein
VVVAWRTLDAEPSWSGTSECPVGEDEEVSIKQVADAIVKAVGFEGEYKVNFL